MTLHAVVDPPDRSHLRAVGRNRAVNPAAIRTGRVFGCLEHDEQALLFAGDVELLASLGECLLCLRFLSISYLA